MTTEEIREHLFGLSDEAYQKFHSGLVPGNDTILGVRVPVLRNYAKELLAQEEVLTLLSVIGTQYYEERMLRGMVIGLWPKAELEEVLEQTKNFLPLIDSWGVCDTFCAGLKITKKYKPQVFSWLMQFVDAKEVYVRRFVLVMLLDYYMEEIYIEQVFGVIDRMVKEEYYVQMAAAWAVSVALVKQYDAALDYLERCHLDDFTYRMAIRKAIESYRITDEQKVYCSKREAFASCI